MTPIDVKTVAKELGVNPSTVYRWEEKGIIPKSRKWGNLRKWYLEDIHSFKKGEYKSEAAA